MQNDSPIILFDGVCNVCSSGVQFVIKHDKNSHFLFSSLQSPFGQKVLNDLGLDQNNFSSLILIDGEKTFYKSTAALKISKKMNGIIPLFWGFIIVPRFIRDWIYSIVARNRYKWFGKKEECWLPTPDLKSRFL